MPILRAWYRSYASRTPLAARTASGIRAGPTAGMTIFATRTAFLARFGVSPDSCSSVPFVFEDSANVSSWPFLRDLRAIAVPRLRVVLVVIAAELTQNLLVMTAREHVASGSVGGFS